MFRSRFANSVATVRSALVPGLIDRALSNRSYAKSSGRSSAGLRAASRRSRKCAAAQRTSSALAGPCSRTIWLSQSVEAKPRKTDSVAEGVIPTSEADDLFICVGVFIHWEAADDKKIQDFNYRATKEAIARAVAGEPRASQVVSQRDKVKHPFAA